ncbi:MAG: hypothetical protein D6746_08630 [Bacteroidetes bacterium]|nr:MAG: hypothetical protein D6746_08630 [Bacteroidota bacterium]
MYLKADTNCKFFVTNSNILTSKRLAPTIYGDVTIHIERDGVPYRDLTVTEVTETYGDVVWYDPDTNEYYIAIDGLNSDLGKHIWHVEMEATTQWGGILFETYCTVSYCELVCEVVEKGTLEEYILYYVLREGQECDCNCERLLNAYQRIIAEIKSAEDECRDCD